MIFFIPLDLFKKTINKERGIIHKARPSFTVVAIFKASSPYFCAAPTTELVSCMAIADHNPKSLWLMLNKCPTAGNINKAIELSMKIVAKATEMSSSWALMIGAMAAMALPPQIAVPEDIKVDAFLFIFSILPNIIPKIRVEVIDISVNKKPSLPTLAASIIFIPKPNPITEYCSNSFVAFPLYCKNGFPIEKDTINPSNKAIGGFTQGEKQLIAIMIKIIFRIIFLSVSSQ